jgi:hypothetical protein
MKKETQISLGPLTDEQLALILATQNAEVNQLKLANAYYEWLLSKKDSKTSLNENQ